MFLFLLLLLLLFTVDVITIIQLQFPPKMKKTMEFSICNTAAPLGAFSFQYISFIIHYYPGVPLLLSKVHTTFMRLVNVFLVLN